MKRAIIALLAGVAVFASVFGLAASLGLTSDELGAGDADVEACANPVNVSYTAEFVAASGYELATVEVGATTGAACVDQDVQITFLDESDDSVLAEHVGTVPADGSMNVSALNVLAEAVGHIHVVITGAAA